MKTVGFAGTAKNTGKTTTALHVLQAGKEAGLRLALTSIGYDGENRDNVTGLPKPRYTLQPGMLVATGSTCLRSSTAIVRAIEETPIHTIFGQVVVGEVTYPGTVLLAGPNRSSDLQHVFDIFTSLGCNLALVDGALNRLVPMTCVDGLVLSTGAAFDQRISHVVEHAGALLRLLRMPVIRDEVPVNSGLWVEFKDQTSCVLGYGSLIGKNLLDTLLRTLIAPVKKIYIPGACDPHLLKLLIDQKADLLRGALMLFRSPLHLVASGDPLLWKEIFPLLEATDIQPSSLQTPQVFFMTVNPFYPRYLDRNGMYEAAYVDKRELLAAACNRISEIPVLDIFQPPFPDVISLINYFAELPDVTRSLC
ncbi:MAG: hypothetical protein HPY45_08835 [Anaerolineae bacterium]|nr:hypothetical protein [Anaerolineae bacterium]